MIFRDRRRHPVLLDRRHQQTVGQPTALGLRPHWYQPLRLVLLQVRSPVSQLREVPYLTQRTKHSGTRGTGKILTVITHNFNNIITNKVVCIKISITLISCINPNLTQLFQLNGVSSFIDCSPVYGFNEALASQLREHQGGLLRLTANGQLPQTPDSSKICDTSQGRCPCFMTGGYVV